MLHAAPYKLRQLADAVDAGLLKTQVALVLVVNGEANIKVADFGTVAANAMLKTTRLGKDYA